MNNKRFKSWKWWLVASPCAVYFVVVLIPFILLEKLTQFINDLVVKVNPANLPTPEWLISVFNWADKDNIY